MGTIGDSPLGKSTHYPDAYDASLLYAVDRAPQRESLCIGDVLPFAGEDRWTAWEVLWLDAQRRPRTGIATFVVPCTSPRIVESKSVKLYFASLNHAAIDGADALEALLSDDLSRATGANVAVSVVTPVTWSSVIRRELEGEPIDDTPPAAFPDAPDAAFLRTSGRAVDESLVFHGFRSVCPVTGQPDYASVRIRCDGPAIDRASLAAYLYGYRRHPGFHEHCVERIYADVANACAPRALAVEARFTRRGGIDINPVRTMPGQRAPDFHPTPRQ